MEDQRIIELYLQRSEEAIASTASKYGGFCYSIAFRILCDSCDAEEAVSDTYMDAWNAIPPHIPNCLSAFLGKITRRNALDRWDHDRAEKRGGGVPALVLEELRDCIPGGTDPQLELEWTELNALLNVFLRSLPEQERRVFLCRYWRMDSIKEISQHYGFTQSKVKSMLLRTREKLRRRLEKEGITV